MTMTRRGFLATLGAAGAAAPLWAAEAPASAKATAGPPKRATYRRAKAGGPTPRQDNVAREPMSRDVMPGQHALKLAEGDRDGLYYIPEGYKAGVRAPLWVVLHGAAGTGHSAQYMFALADQFGVILIAPDSRDERTWDGVLRNWGPDVEFIGTAVGHVASLCSVDRDRMTVAGFSDGASYALGFGISFGDDFSRIVSMSPGVMQPMAARGKPKIFISHGTSDRVMPIDITSRRFVPRLKTLGYDVTYREYEGGHRPSPPIVREAFEWALR